MPRDIVDTLSLEYSRPGSMSYDLSRLKTNAESESSAQ